MLLLNLLLLILIGLSVGSFLNVLIFRSLSGEKLTGRSHCPHCHHQLGFWDLLPVFSYLALGGRCRYCAEKISPQYPLIEMVTTLLFVMVGYFFLINATGLNLQLIFSILIFLFGISTLLAVFVTDYRSGLIPNRIIIPAILTLIILKLVYLLLLFGLTYVSLAHDSGGIGKYLLPPYSNYLLVILYRFGIPIVYDLLAGLAVGLVFYLLVLFTKGRAMGGGDIKLGFFIGVLNGWPLSLVALMIAFITGAIYSVVLLIIGKKKFGQTVPFGPFLVSGSLITLFWGQWLFDFYINLIR